MKYFLFLIPLFAIALFAPLGVEAEVLYDCSYTCTNGGSGTFTWDSDLTGSDLGNGRDNFCPVTCTLHEEPEPTPVDESCNENEGTACSSEANNCDATNSGTIQCDGTCSAEMAVAHINAIVLEMARNVPRPLLPMSVQNMEIVALRKIRVEILIPAPRLYAMQTRLFLVMSVLPQNVQDSEILVPGVELTYATITVE
jgi:hypothetical protein